MSPRLEIASTTDPFGGPATSNGMSADSRRHTQGLTDEHYDRHHSGCHHTH
jgi:hypothetical protein